MHGMGVQPIVCVFHTITIGTMIIEKHYVINNGLKNATCKHSLIVTAQLKKKITSKLKIIVKNKSVLCDILLRR